MSPGSLQTYLNNKILEPKTPPDQHPTIFIDEEQEIFNKLEDTFQTDIGLIYQLAHIANQIRSHNTFSAYTDGSLTYFKESKFMGFKWTLQDPNNQYFNFQGQTTNFSSSTRAEITAILTLITIIPTTAQSQSSQIARQHYRQSIKVFTYLLLKACANIRIGPSLIKS